MRKTLFATTFLSIFSLGAIAGETANIQATNTLGTSLKDSSHAPVTTQDGALSCEYDNDFSCADWGDSADVANLAWEINNNEIRIEVDEAWLTFMREGFENGFLLAQLLAIAPAAAYRNLLDKYGREQVKEKFGPELAAAIEVIALKALENYLIDLAMSYSPKLGDVLVFKDGNVTIIKKEDLSGSSGSGGGSAGGGSDSNGGNPGSSGGFPTFGGTYIGPSCIVVRTGPPGDMTSHISC